METKLISITNSILHVFLKQETDLPVGCGDALVNTVTNTFSARLQDVTAALTNAQMKDSVIAGIKTAALFRYNTHTMMAESNRYQL